MVKRIVSILCIFTLALSLLGVHSLAALLDKAGIGYTKLLAEENVELTNALGIKQAPTLVVAVGGEIAQYKGVSDVKKYIQSVQ